MAFYSTDAELALMAPDDVMGHLYPSTTCQSPPSIMYSPPLHHLSHRSQTTMSGNGSMYNHPQDYRQVMDSPYPPHALWSSQSPSIPMPQVSSYSYPPFSGIASPPILTHETTLVPQSFGACRPSRSHSASSSAGLSIPCNVPSERSPPLLSRSLSPSSPDLRAYGNPNKNGTWSCAYPGCTSRAVFTRGCDLRKHHKRHTKSFFCRHADCPQSSGGGFSSKKDLARHEAKHNPGVLCDWDGCDRVFSRVDNMRDHVKRIHLKASRKSSITST
ncbi:C2H2 type zinc finger domain-containing protein [Decorospora gaudefroyi]|uniref:C2H2 type zinc finger domain-containing protein n=1 Tax=Decorospora gaudefroyi TaxID=184978 RepID=A0A6A5KWL0_9PLEO|nr:C2H2 type zinc finger domain-containing protein [Decorospora gaudefroyi]